MGEGKDSNMDQTLTLTDNVISAALPTDISD